MKFEIPGVIKIDTDDKYHPVVLNDNLVDVFFVLTGLSHGAQAYRYRHSIPWVGFHSVAALLSLYWPFQIHKGYTHKGLSHASYGLLTMIPHATALQVFGTLMLMDKIYNLGNLKWPNGIPVFDRSAGPLNKYGIDNMFLDNAEKPQSVNTLAVNIPFITVMSLSEYLASKYGNQPWLPKVIQATAVGAGLLAGKTDWIDGRRF